MLWYLGALGSYCLGYGAYAGAAHLGAPVPLARVVGVMVGLTPLGIWLFRWIRARLTPTNPADLTASQRHPDGWIRRGPRPGEPGLITVPGSAPFGDSGHHPSGDVIAVAEPERAIPCRRCGAAMAPIAVAGAASSDGFAGFTGASHAGASHAGASHAGASHAGASHAGASSLASSAGLAGQHERLHCRFCQLVDDVPRDAAARLAFLRHRAAELRATRQALGDTDRRVAEVLEDGRWLRGTLLAALGPLGIILLLVVLPMALTGGAKGALIGVGLLSQLAGIVLGMGIAYRTVARRYFRTVRPRILARAPERPGAPARCRVCGGPIEFRGAAFCDCPFCGSANLIGTDLLRDAHRFLGEEVAEYQRRAAGAERDVATHHKLMAYGLVAGNLLGSMLGSAALAALIAAVWKLLR